MQGQSQELSGLRKEASLHPALQPGEAAVWAQR